jgi:release factor glutamine methyltransferase
MAWAGTEWPTIALRHSDHNPTQPVMTSSDEWTVRRILDWTMTYLKEHGSDTPRLDAEILLAHARNSPRIQLYTQFDDPLTEPQRATMRDLVKRRAAAEPVAYLVGHKEFFSLDFLVNRHVLIPRPDTETLVMAVLDAVRERRSRELGAERPRAEGQGPSDSALDPQPSAPLPTEILELGTGSGCIAVALAKNLPDARVTAVELSPEAIQVAHSNVERHQLSERITLLEGDLFASVGEGRRFDVIVSNPPYVPRDELARLDADVREHEPHHALDGGPDGLDVVRRIVAESPGYLKEQGWLMLELSSEQAPTVQQLMRERGFQTVRIKQDLAGRDRVIVGKWPA